MISRLFRILPGVLTALLLSGCSGSDDNGNETVLPVTESSQQIAQPEPVTESEEQAIGFEILQAVSPEEIIVWVNGTMSQAEFDAIDLPEGWFKNQPRETDPDGGRFLRSPGATQDGPLLEETLFGHLWQQNAVIVQTGFSVGGESLLTGNSVAKFHEVTFEAVSTLHLLISPEGEQFVRISRDAGRTNELPTVPDTWQTGEYIAPQVMTFMLPNPTLNIRLDNEDSFQGPISPVATEEIANLAFGSGISTAAGEAPIALSTDLCENPANASSLQEIQGDVLNQPSYGQLDPAVLQSLLQQPTEGPFYMVNLIRFRDMAVYADGRETDLTGREANALYSPTEFIQAIGARIVFSADVNDAVAGEDGTWDQVSIVEYPCPLAFVAMSAHPGFQTRSIHKDAAVDASIVMPTFAQSLDSMEPQTHPFPATSDDPAFELVQVLDLRQTASYTDEQSQGTGEQALSRYAEALSQAQLDVGISPKMRLDVAGVLIGDGSEWNSVWIDAVPSQSALDALNMDARVIDAQFHRDAAVEEEYVLATTPLVSLGTSEFGRGSRYCEVLLVGQSETGLSAEVWGTQGLNFCPQAALDALDLQAIAAESDALQAVINGPRIWLTQGVSNEARQMEVQAFGGLTMSLLAILQLDSGAVGQAEVSPYTETTVLRSTTFLFRQGDPVYELTSPEGVVYVMQSVSLEVDPTLDLDALPDLAARLALPAGWAYSERVLEADWELIASGEATVITDDLENTYQRVE